MVKAERLASLPSIAALRTLTQSLAMLDAILCPEWEYRFWSFDSTWAEGEMMASMRDGSGDEVFILFTGQGAIMKGFAHESPMSPYANNAEEPWPGVLSQVPPQFQAFLTEPAFSMQDVTFVIWQRNQDRGWQTGNIDYPAGSDPDGSDDLLALLDGAPATYRRFAESYYERDVPLAAVEHVYEHKAVTDDIIAALNADLSIDALMDDIRDIGYPHTSNMGR